MGFRSKLELKFHSQGHSLENENLHFPIWGEAPLPITKSFAKIKKKKNQTVLLACNKKYSWGNSLSVQWLGLGTFTAEDPGSVPD